MKMKLALVSLVSFLAANQAMAWGSYNYSITCRSKSVTARIGVACAEADGCDSKLIALRVNGRNESLKKFTISTDTAASETYQTPGLILAVNKESSSSVALIFNNYAAEGNSSGQAIIKSHKMIAGDHPASEIKGKTETFKCVQGQLSDQEYESMGE
jgi:hypothetical protein